jgi:hypothetical protein
MSEMSQIHEFVSEIGEDVEVQWGASLDESLEDNVRVTIIATGFEVSNIPGLDDAVGKKTVDEAIKDFYEEPKQPETPKEEKPTVVNDDIDLQIVVGNDEDEHVESVVSMQPIKHEDGDIVIDFDIEDQAMDQEPTQSSQSSMFTGWMRGRK